MLQWLDAKNDMPMELEPLFKDREVVDMVLRCRATAICEGMCSVVLKAICGDVRLFASEVKSDGENGDSVLHTHLDAAACSLIASNLRNLNSVEIKNTMVKDASIPRGLEAWKTTWAGVCRRCMLASPSPMTAAVAFEEAADPVSKPASEGTSIKKEPADSDASAGPQATELVVPAAFISMRRLLTAGAEEDILNASPTGKRFPFPITMAYVKVIIGDLNGEIWNIFRSYAGCWDAVFWNTENKLVVHGPMAAMKMPFSGDVELEPKADAIELGNLFGLPLYLNGAPYKSPFSSLCVPAWSVGIESDPSKAIFRVVDETITLIYSPLHSGRMKTSKKTDILLEFKLPVLEWHQFVDEKETSRACAKLTRPPMEKQIHKKVATAKAKSAKVLGIEALRSKDELSKGELAKDDEGSGNDPEGGDKSAENFAAENPNVQNKNQEKDTTEVKRKKVLAKHLLK